MTQATVKCPEGHPNPAGQRFCGQCATPLAGLCPNGHANPAERKYCGFCGTRLAPQDTDHNAQTATPAQHPDAPGAGGGGDTSGGESGRISGSAGKKRTAILVALAAMIVLLIGLAVGTYYNHYFVGPEGDGRVAIFRGNQPYLLGCIDGQGQLRTVRYDADHSGCRFLRVEDLKTSERPQVIAGFLGGSLDYTTSQLWDVVQNSLLPLCAAAQLPGAECRPPAAGH